MSVGSSCGTTGEERTKRWPLDSKNLMKDSRTCAEVIVGIMCPFYFSEVNLEKDPRLREDDAKKILAFARMTFAKRPPDKSGSPIRRSEFR
jgi:hypothetical protein